MAKRGPGRPPLPRFAANWGAIYREVWDMVAAGTKYTEACHEVGRRRGVQGQYIAKRFKAAERQGLAVRRMVDRANRGLKRN